MNNTATATPMERTSIQEGLIVALLGFTVVLVVMNTMMFNLALPKIAAEFKLTSVASSWIVTGYSIVFAISSITFSRLSDFCTDTHLVYNRAYVAWSRLCSGFLQ